MRRERSNSLLRAKRESDRNDSLVAVGIPSLITVLVVMLLGCFAVLSLITARSDRRLAVKAADAISDFYSADLEATNKLTELKKLISAGANPLDSGYTLETIDGRDIICYNIQIDDNNSLFVEIDYDKLNGTLSIVKWQTASNTAQTH